MYLIPKNIKVKREIFKGFGIIEILIITISFGIGFILKGLASNFKLKLFLFLIIPMTSFMLLLPLPNGITVFVILKKFLKYQFSQKNYKFK